MQPNEFIKLFPDSIIQTFDDKAKNKSLAQVFQFDIERMRKLEKRGAGIYFSVNGFKEHRRKDCLTRLNGCFLDFDLRKEGENKEIESKIGEAVKNLEAKRASVIIRTKNGLQAIWLLNDEYDEKKFLSVEMGIILDSKGIGGMGDIVKDVTRVLRFPEFLHQKGEPFMVKLLKYNPLNVFKLDELSLIFPYNKEKTDYKPIARDSFVLRQIANIDFQKIIQRAFAVVGRQAEFDKQQRLILDGRLTGTFQGKNDDRRYLASTSHEPYEGNEITATAQIMGCTNKDAFRWLVQEFNLKPEYVGKMEIKREEKKLELPSEFITWEQAKDISVDIALSEKQILKYYLEPLDRNLGGIFSGELVVITAGTGIGKSDLAFNIAYKNAQAGHKIAYIGLEMHPKALADRRIVAAYNKKAREKRESCITILDYLMNKLDAEKQKIIFEIINNEKNLEDNLLLYTGKNMDLEQLEIMFDYLQSTKVELIVLDHLHYFVMHDKQDNAAEAIGRIMRKIKTLTRTHNVPVILVSHVRRRQDESKKPHSNDLYGSSSIDKEADTLIIIHRDKWAEDYKQQLQTTFSLEKSRIGILAKECFATYDLELRDYVFKNLSESVGIKAEYNQTSL